MHGFCILVRSPLNMSIFTQKTAALILIFIICLSQYGCANRSTIPRSVVKDALNVQIALTDSVLKDGLDLEAWKAEITNVRVDGSVNYDYPTGRLELVSGYFSWKVPGSNDNFENPFHIFLERGEMNQSWRLLKPSISPNGLSQNWTPYALPIKD